MVLAATLPSVMGVSGPARAAVPEAQFAPFRSYPVPLSVQSVAIGDFTGDGRDDVVANTVWGADPARAKLFVYAQTPAGELEQRASLAVSSHSRWAKASLAAGVVAGFAGSSASSSAAAVPASGILTRFAGGVGEGRATDVAQSPGGLAARNGRLVSTELYQIVYSVAHPGLVRNIDLVTGYETVLAGVFTGGYRGDGGPATSAQLSRATDAAIDAAGNVYITDTDNARVRKVTPTGTITTFAGNGVAGYSGDGATASSASINRPTGIAVSPSGDVVFADGDNLRLRRVSPNGTITTIAGTGQWTGPAGDGGPATDSALAPMAVAFDGVGNLYATDQSHRSLRKITADGTITTVVTPEFFPGALAVDGPGNIYLVSGRAVVKVGPGGIVTTVAGAEATAPAGSGNGDGGLAAEAHLQQVWDLAVDGGNVYLSELSTYRIRRVDPAGIITTVAGNGSYNTGGDGGQARNAQFPYVSKVRSGPTGTYFWSAVGSDDGYIHRVDPSGVVTTIHHGKVDGLAVDNAGNVLFSDHNQVRRLTPSGTLSTIAGTGEYAFGGDGGPATLARLAWPRALALDGAGNLFISDWANHLIRRVDALGLITTYVGGAEFDPHQAITLARETALGDVGDLAVDTKGSLYWSESAWNYPGIRKVTCGIVSRVTPEGRSSDSLAIDAAGSLFFTAGNEVRRLDTRGTLSTVAGSGGSAPMDGIPATSVALERPGGVTIQPSGELLFGHDNQILRVEGVTGGRTVPGPACDNPPDRPMWGVGHNLFGQLGDGTTTSRDLPAADSPPLTDVTAVAGGYIHSLAVRNDGTVWAWGWNGVGQLGDGTATDRLGPVPVAGLTGVVAVAAGLYNSLALKSDGTVWAWGWNGYGQLGDGTTSSRLRPVRVAGLTGVTAISAGALHGLALRSDGSVWAWGWNGTGQLGDGTVVDRWLPTRVPGISGATAVAAGGLHSLAVLADGSVRAWGWNAYGQLGDGTATDRHLPVPVFGLTGAKALSAGWYHTLALRTDGTVAAWGLGQVGQLGNRSTASSLTPVTPQLVTGVVAIAAGMFHSVALLGDGHVMTWGWDGFGQLAVHGTFEFYPPAEIEALDHVAAISAGAYHTLFAYRFVPRSGS